MLSRSGWRLRSWHLLIILRPARKDPATNLAHALLDHSFDFMSQRAIGQSPLHIVAQSMQLSNHVRLTGEALIQRTALGGGLNRFIFHELLPLTQTPLKSATILYASAITYDCTL